MISLKIAGVDRTFTSAAATIDLASNSTQATITYRIPFGAAWDKALDEIILGENPQQSEYGVATPFDDYMDTVGGTAVWASTQVHTGIYAPATGQAVYADKTSPQPDDALYG